MAVFIHITLPGIRGVSQVIVVLHIIWTFVNFDVIYLLTKGGPLRMTGSCAYLALPGSLRLLQYGIMRRLWEYSCLLS